MGPRKRHDRDPSSHIGFLDDVDEDARRKKKQRRRDDDDDLDLDRIWSS